MQPLIWDVVFCESLSEHPKSWPTNSVHFKGIVHKALMLCHMNIFSFRADMPPIRLFPVSKRRRALEVLLKCSCLHFTGSEGLPDAIPVSASSGVGRLRAKQLPLKLFSARSAPVSLLSLGAADRAAWQTGPFSSTWKDSWQACAFVECRFTLSKRKQKGKQNIKKKKKIQHILT